MTVFRLRSAVNSLTTKPQPAATSDWWNLCDACNHLDGPHDTQDAAEAATHRCRRRKPRSEPAERTRGHVWTEAEDELVRTLPPAEAAQAVGVSGTTITRRRAHLGVSQVRGKIFEWTPEQDAIVAAHSISDAVRLLTGRTAVNVRHRRWKLTRLGVELAVTGTPGPKTKAA